MKIKTIDGATFEAADAEGLVLAMYNDRKKPETFLEWMSGYSARTVTLLKIAGYNPNPPRCDTPEHFLDDLLMCKVVERIDE